MVLYLKIISSPTLTSVESFMLVSGIAQSWLLASWLIVFSSGPIARMILSRYSTYHINYTFQCLRLLFYRPREKKILIILIQTKLILFLLQLLNMKLYVFVSETCFVTSKIFSDHYTKRWKTKNRLFLCGYDELLFNLVILEDIQF